MATSSDESYGAGIDDEDLLEAFSQPSQTLPEHPRRHESQSSGASADEDDEDERASKKRKYRIQVGDKEVPAGQVIGATQAEALPDSSPYRIRGPIYKKARIEPPSPAPAPMVAVQSTTASHHVALPQPKAAPLLKSSFARTVSGISIEDDEAFARELQDLPDDAFSSDDEFAQPREEPPAPTSMISLGSSFSRPRSPQAARQRGVAAPSATQMRQTTLFGGRAPATVTASQTRNVHAYRVDKPVELPTHHKLNEDKLATWIYPTNLGAQRDYQFSIVSKGLFSNLLVALPTGLGKTFIAATVMYNYFRWTRDAQIIFVAPTKPLVAQQVDACFNIVGLPRSATTMLTGDQVPALRAEEWAEKRVFFMTPQTLMNDLSTGIADPKKIVLLVVDEAHRATGDYAYNKVVQFMRRFNNSFRILALTATPGASLEAVQEVIDGLGISKVEIRTELSIDIQPYTHTRNTEIVLLDPSDETIMIKELLTHALQPLANQLCAQNAYYSNDPMTYNAFQLMQARKKWMAEKGRNASMGLKGMVNSLFSVLSSVAHSIKLLNFHGIGPFFSSLQDFQNEVQDGKGGKYKKQITENADFRKMMDRIRGWINKPDFVGHPKLTHLCDRVLNHFLDAGEGRLAEGAPPSSTRIIVFAEYRESAEDIARVLNRHGPMIRASVFVGQADSKRSEGMNQVKQQETINKFKNGIFNVIVATSIGEEGLDIGQVDLIVCYDASASPIRMLQRMGRTGRKRAGNIVLLLMRGKEEEKFAQAKDNYEKIQKMISEGVRFTFRHDLSSRIIPKEIQPIVEKREIVIPQENTQDQSLPEPRRRAAKTKKKPAKKFHMPDGVETGFTTATGRALKERGGAGAKKPEEVVQLAEIPALESVLLRPAEMAELAATYQKVSGSDLQEVEMPSLTSHPVAQRSLLLTARVPHGSYTKRCVGLFKKLGESQDVEERLARPFGDEEPEISWSVPDLVDERTLSSKVSKSTGVTASKAVTPIAAKQPRKKQPKKQISAPTHFDSEDDTPKAQTKKKKKKKQPQTRRALSLSADESPDEHEASPSSEGEGHDLARSSARSEDDSELGSLRDFLASSSPALLHRHSNEKKKKNTHREPTSLSTSTPLSPAAADKENLSSSPGCANRLFFPTQETNDSMPDVEEILGLGERRVRGGVRDARGLSDDEDDHEDEDEEVERPVAPRARQRRVVEDDSDE